MAAESMPRRVLRRVPFVVGLVAILAVVNVAVGAGYDRVVDHRTAPTPLWSPLGDGDAQAARWSTPAMAGRPWTAEYADEIAALRYRYQTFLTYDQVDHRGAHVNIEGGVRRSWSAPRAGSASRPVVSINGGSLVFGVGQRDEHTVASEIARLAAADGLPIDVRNAGRPGWTTWQSMLGFERDLASTTSPDVAVFLGGVEDLTGQPNAEGRLSFGDLPGTQAAVLGSVRAQQRWDRIKAGYVRLSVVHRAVRWAGIGNDGVPEGPPEPLHLSRAQAAGGARSHARAWAVARELGDQAGVTTHAYWQPMLLADRAAAPRPSTLGPGTVDLSHLLDGRPDAFVDAGTVDEAGARSIARRMWTDLRPDVERWYRDHPTG